MSSNDYYGSGGPGYGHVQQSGPYGQQDQAYPPQEHHGSFPPFQQQGPYGASPASHSQQPLMYGSPGSGHDSLSQPPPSYGATPHEQFQHQYQYPPAAGYGDNRGNSPFAPTQQDAYGDPAQQHVYADPSHTGSSVVQGNDGPQGERGLGTSMLGAGAGALLGHQVGHGGLGAIGGALAANFIGGDKKKKKKEKKHKDHHHKHHHHHHDEHHSSHHGSSHGSSSHGGGSHYAGYAGSGAALGGLYAGRPSSHGGHKKHRSHSRGVESDSSSSSDSD